MPLHEKLQQETESWRNEGYSCDYPLIGEILRWQAEGDPQDRHLKYLREPQFRALETYWCMRLHLGTPHVIDIYKRYYGDDKKAFFEALGAPISADAVEWAEIEEVIEKVKSDSDWVRKNRIQALHEAAILDYPSYILALAMGAGKTVLIGTIIATEFAMSLRYPDGKFMKNALVFAPGTTIIESLRELSDMPYEKILPPGLNRDFMANLKIEYPGKQKDIPVQKGSGYNLIVTNTEKISLRVNSKKNNQQKEAFERAKLQANLRLQAIASLPNLGVFSDEAHHTYGNTFDKLKRVRETINYIHEQTPIVAVINTTGTPYYKRQTLKEVIVWYGLGDGIKDNILKDLNNGIHQYDIGKQEEREVFDDIILEFFKTYGEVSLPDGAKAKMAFYFKTQEHLNDSRQLIEQAITQAGGNVSQILVNTQTSTAAEVDEFKRLNNPTNQKRIILLIGKGVEGWNCPSLFACALIKEQTSNNYVLQAATRCLRQVPGNQHSAKIFLDYDNAKTLDKELQNNFGTDLDRLSAGTQDKTPVTLRIVKTELPKLEITRTVKRAVRTKAPNGKITLEKPKPKKAPRILRSILTPDFDGPREILMPTGDMKELPAGKETEDCHTAAWKISSRYHLPVMPILKKLNDLYPKGEMPNSHLYGLFQQVEEQQANYKTVEEKVTEVMALIRVKNENGKDIFEKNEDGVYVHHLRLLKKTYDRMERKGLFAKSEDYEDKHNLSFHYTPYNFDSEPERSLFRQVLSMLKTAPDDIEAFLFTGGLTDPEKTDFHFEYMGEDKRYYRYFPDFVIVKKTGEFYIVEIKADNKRGDKIAEAKRKAVEQLQNLQLNKFKYQVIYAKTNTVDVTGLDSITDWMSD